MSKPPHPMQLAKAWIKAGLPKHLHMSLVALADAIDRREGVVWKTQKAMAAEWGIAPRTFKRHLAELESLGVIEREKRHRKYGALAGTRTSDRIKFGLPPEKVESPVRGHDGGPLSMSQGATAVTPTRGHDGGPAKFSSGVSSPDGASHPLDSVGADAPNSQEAVAGERQVERERVPIPEGMRCNACVSFDEHEEWCSQPELVPEYSDSGEVPF